MPAARFVLALLLLAMSACGGGGETASGDRPAPSPAPTLQPSEPFGLTEVALRGPDGQRITVPVYDAAEPETRGRGLMERDELPDGTGMVFRFPADSSGGFYMYRTRIPLSIAFYDQAGRIVSVLDMEPCPSQDSSACPTYSPGVPYRGAIEVDQGWFAEAGVGEGWHVELPADLPDPS